jgi:hypothetical protein
VASEEIRTITYRFRWDDGREKRFDIRLLFPSMRLVETPPPSLPDWTKLEFHQCPNCPLKPADSPRCPPAVSLVSLVELFKDSFSTEVVDVTITAPEREYRKRMGIQDGLSSMMGIYMAAAGCPVLDKLRPMLYSHLPFSTLRETVFRAISTYLMAQLLKHRRGEPASLDLAPLVESLEQINEVNRTFILRLHSLGLKDASLNALVRLDCLAGYSSFQINKDHIKQLEAVFGPYLDPGK